MIGAPDRLGSDAETDADNNAEVVEIVDVAFEVAGEAVPADYRHALRGALLQELPWLGDEAGAGIHGIRTVATDYGVALLARRSRLTLRLPRHRLAAACALEGRRIEVAGHALAIGATHVRPLPVADTLHADFVTTGSDDELAFGRDVAAALARLETPCRYVCGRHRALDAGGRCITGYALALHGLAAAASLRLQREGLGAARTLGCGVFVRHKSIAGLD